MASRSVDNVQHSVMSLSETVSSAIQSSTSLPVTMNSTTSSAVALASAALVETNVQIDAQASRSWIGMFGKLVLLLITVIPGVLYWLITFATITMPTFLFTLFSTSLTFTMNATTL